MSVARPNGERKAADTTWDVVTPENIRFHFRLAGPASRTFAFLLDSLLKAAVALIGWRLLSFWGAFGWGFYLVALFLVEWAYFILFEILWNGQSPGKRMLHLRVIGENGAPLTWQQSVLRNLLRPADQLPLLYAVGGIVMLFTKRFQRLGDLAAGTIVVVEDTVRMPVAPPPIIQQTDPLLRGMSRSLPVDEELRKAALLYMSKREILSASLRQELAQPVADRLCALVGLPRDTDPDLLMCALYRFLFSTQGLKATDTITRHGPPPILYPNGRVGVPAGRSG